LIVRPKSIFRWIIVSSKPLGKKVITLFINICFTTVDIDANASKQTVFTRINKGILRWVRWRRAANR
jgi:hypothetical protein